MGRAQERGNWSGSYHHFPGVRQQNQTSRVEWKGLGKKQRQSSGSEIALTWLPDPFTSYTILGTSVEQVQDLPGWSFSGKWPEVTSENGLLFT